MQLQSFFTRFKRHFWLFFSVLFCTFILTFSFFNWSNFSFSSQFNSQKQQIILRCEEDKKACLATEKAIWEDEAVLQTMLLLAKSNNKYQIQKLVQDQTIKGFLITPDRFLSTAEWKKFETTFAAISQKTSLFQQTVTPQLHVVKNNLWKGISWEGLLTCLFALTYLIFFVWQLLQFGSGWGSFNLLFNLSLTTLMLLISQKLNIIMNPANLTFFVGAWFIFAFWQTKMMQASFAFRTQKSFWQLWKRNYVFLKQTAQILVFFALFVFTYFLINFPPFNQKLFLTSFELFLLPNSLFDISKLFLLLFLVFGLGLSCFYQGFLFTFFHLFHKDYYRFNPLQAQDPEHGKLVANKELFPLAFSSPLTKKRIYLALGSLFLAVLGFILLPLLYGLLSQPEQLLGRTTTTLSTGSVQPWLFFDKWKVLLITLAFILLLHLGYNWFLFGWRLSLLWLGKMLIGYSFAILFPIGISLLFVDLRLNNTMLFFFFCLIFFKTIQSFIFFQQLTFENAFSFPTASFVIKCCFAIYAVLPFLFWFGIDWKRSLFFLIVLNFNQIVQFLERNFCFWGWKLFQQWKAANLVKYNRFKAQPFLEKEIAKIND